TWRSTSPRRRHGKRARPASSSTGATASPPSTTWRGSSARRVSTRSRRSRPTSSLPTSPSTCWDCRARSDAGQTGDATMTVRLPPMEAQAMSEAQRKAAEALIAGPRKAVAGPFIALLRSPELLDRMQRVGEYLRFDNAIPQRLVELAILLAARHVGNAFE